MLTLHEEQELSRCAQGALQALLFSISAKIMDMISRMSWCFRVSWKSSTRLDTIAGSRI